MVKNMTHKFEIHSQDAERWLTQLHLIAEFCERIGSVADQAKRPLHLHLIVHPEEPRVYPRQPRLPYN